MAKFVLIGGGDVGRGNTSYQTEVIDKKVVELTGKVNPNFLFVGLASSFSDSYFDTMKKIYKDLGCECVYLKKKNIINNPDIVKNKIEAADIIYFCGGDSVKLVNDLKEYGIDELLREKIKNDVVIVGISAGAIMCCNKGYSDSLKMRGESDRYEFVMDGERCKELVTDVSDEVIVCVEDVSALVVTSCGDVIGNVYLYDKEFKKINYLDIK